MRRSANDFIVVHCAATKPSQDALWGEDEIRAWHMAPPNNWSDIGYNAVIKRDGTIEIGRHPDEQGAHVAGYNHRAIGICLVGGIDESGQPDANYTDAQWEALLVALRFFRHYAPKARIMGHRDFPGVAKACPSFNVREWLGATAPELIRGEMSWPE